MEVFCVIYSLTIPTGKDCLKMTLCGVAVVVEVEVVEVEVVEVDLVEVVAEHEVF